jgi:hypothetical protein
MTFNTIRFDRNIGLFGSEGQERLHQKSVTIIGLGGVGSWIAPQIALLGPRKISVVDPEELANTDRNRSGTARHTDPVPGSLKVDLAERLIHDIDPAITVNKVSKSLLSEEAFAAVIDSDAVFGCVDKDGLRFVLNEIAVAYEKPLIDVATDVPEPGVYGGRVFFGVPGDACLVCMGLLDMSDVRRFFLTQTEREAEDAIYGIPRRLLSGTGPAVVSLNMATAGIAGTEFMVWATAMRAPQRLITYSAHRSLVTVCRDAPRADCYYCRVVRGQRDAANVGRYLAHIRQQAAA